MINSSHLKGGQIVASYENELPPPEQTTSDDEVLLLGLIAEETPSSLMDGVVGQPGATGNSQVLAVVVQCCELHKRKERV